MTPRFNKAFSNLVIESTSTGKTLYHGSAISKFKGQDLDKVYLVGGGEETGDTMIDWAYGDEYSEWEDYEDERDTPVFAAEKTTLQAAANAMAFAIASNKDKTMWDITETDIRSDGILFIFYEGDHMFDRYDSNEYSDAADNYKGLEDGDYYGDIVKPDAYLVGKKLIQFLRRHGIKFDKS